MSKKQSLPNGNPADLSVGKLISSLNTSQLWGLIIAIAAFGGAMFSGGKFLGSLAADRKMETVVTDNDKVQFLNAALSYELTLKFKNQNSDSANILAFQNSRKVFINLIAKWWNKQQNQSAEVGLTLDPVISKDFDMQGSKIKFHDQSTWPIPQEIKQAVLNGH